MSLINNIKFIDVFQDKKILYKSEEEKIELFKKLEKIKVHNILNLNFLDQFILYIFQSDEDKLILRLYKKNYDFITKEWNKNKLLLITSLALEFENNEENIYNVDNIDNQQYIQEHDIKLEDIEFIFYFPYDVKEKDLYFYNQQQYNTINIDENFEEKTLSSNWGHNVNYKDIRWMINIETLINSNYGVDDKFYYKFRCSHFEKKKFTDIYYYSIEKDTLIYQKILNTVSFVCDRCNKNFNDLENINIWHNNLYGDLCERCINSKLKKEKYKKNIILNKILLIGKKKIFEKELIRTKLFLAKNKIKEFNIEKKYQICKKLLNNSKNIIVNSYNTCSICLDNMEYDIYAGSCGHCFHKKCVLSLKKDECPLCRVKTDFFKLYLE